MRIPRAVVPVLAVGVMAACGKPPANSGAMQTDTARPSPGVELGAAAQLDSGNAAYRAKDFAGALAFYRKATERQPRFAAGWFGVYMAQNALGNKPGADSALRQVQNLDPAAAAGAHAAGGPGAGMLPPGHPGAGDTGLPPGHPAPK